MSLLRRRKRKKIAEHLAIREIDELHNLAENVFFIRQALGLSQESLAEKAEITQPQVANIEAGHANPTVRTLARLAHGLSTSTYQLFAPQVADDDCVGYARFSDAFLSESLNVFRTSDAWLFPSNVDTDLVQALEGIWASCAGSRPISAADREVTVAVERTKEPLAGAA